MSNKLVAGIDISKAFSDICIFSPRNEIIVHTTINNDYEGMKSIDLTFKKLETDYNTQLVVIMEATAHYHQLLANFFRKLDYEIIVINPIQSAPIKDYKISKSSWVNILFF